MNTLVLIASLLSADADWPSFRGPGANGVAAGHATVEAWDVESGINIRWKTPIPGLAHSCPVIAGDRLFVTSALREGGEAELKVGLYGDVKPVEDEGAHEFNVYCLNKRSGEILWSRTAIKTVPEVKRHPKGSFAASTPATNGTHVVAFFGSQGLYCYDIEGELKWSKDFGVLDAGWYVQKDMQWGYGASPIIHNDMVIVQCDVQDNSFLGAFRLETGEEIWRMPRDDVPTWSTPTVHTRADGSGIVLCNGWKHIGGYDLKTGKEVWKLEGGGDIPVPTPIIAHDHVFITNAHGRMAPIIAIDLDAKGELELSSDDEHISWMLERRGNYMQTPLVYEDRIYMCTDGGVVGCYDAVTGEEHFRARLSSGQTGFTASPVAADGKIYYTAESGQIYVIRAAKIFGIMSVNEMGIECMASPAISEGVIYWRTRNEVIAVGATE